MADKLPNVSVIGLGLIGSSIICATQYFSAAATVTGFDASKEVLKHFREHCEGARLKLSTKQMLQIEEVLPVGWAQGDRYSDKQWIGPEKYC